MKIRLTLYGWYLLLIVFIGLSVFCLMSCKSTSSVETNNETHKVSELVDKMDSLVSRTTMWQQDIWQKQSSLVDSIRQMERNDSSHTVVVNEKGDTLKETILIERVIERERNTESKESELVVHLQSQVDSLIQLSVANKALTDSLLKEHNKETVITKEPTLWQKIKATVGGWAIVIIVFFIIFYSFRFYFTRKRANSNHGFS